MSTSMLHTQPKSNEPHNPSYMDYQPAHCNTRRAVGMRNWAGESFENMIIAMDSEYVVLGMTERIHKWKANNWRKSDGKPVANRDMWEALLGRVRYQEERGCHIQFWLIPRELNEADKYAKRAAAMRDEEREQGDPTEPVCFFEKGTEGAPIVLNRDIYEQLKIAPGTPLYLTQGEDGALSLSDQHF